MRKTMSWVAAVAALASGSGVGCGGRDAALEATAVEPRPIGRSDCATCSMIVAEQPSPRGQLVHRDGTRQYFCSVADLLVYLAAPSPHGPPVQVYVEAEDPSVDPAALATAPRPWAKAEDLAYVVGFERPVMGMPALAFARLDDARTVAQRLGARVATWQELPERMRDRHGSESH